MNVTPIYIYIAHAQIIELELRRFNLFHLQRFDAADISEPVLFLACGVPNDDMEDSTRVVVVTLDEPVLWDVGVVGDVDITTCVAFAVGNVEITECVAVAVGDVEITACVAVAVGDVEITARVAVAVGDVDITAYVADAVEDVETTACVAVEDVNGRSVVRSSHFGSPTSHGSCTDPWL